MNSQSTYLPFKLGRICNHRSIQNSTNHIDIPCSRSSINYHRVVQASKICNKCTIEIWASANSINTQQYCSFCSQTFQSLLADRWICTHKDQSIQEIVINCQDNKKEIHEITLARKICQVCLNKARAAFMFRDSCAICAGLENQVMENLDKTIVQSSFYYFDEVIKKLKKKNAEDSKIKLEIQSYCLADPKVLYNTLFEQQQKKFGQNTENNHLSKRYQLYPKCPKHRKNYIDVCNSCLCSILNMNMCPYGCPYQKKDKGPKIQNKSFTSDIGFFCLYPKQTKDYQYLQYFNLKLTQEQSGLNKWQSNLKKIKYSGKENICSQFSLYAGTVQIDKFSILYTGGIAGKTKSQMKTTNNCFLIEVSQDLKTFTVKDQPKMIQSRSGHGIVFWDSYVYVVGGFCKEKGSYLKQCEKFNVKLAKWEKLPSLNVSRSRSSIIAYKGKIYTFGGVSNLGEIYQSQCEVLNSAQNKWENLTYKGFGNPWVTGTSAINNIWGSSNYENLIIVGGSNYETSLQLLQNLEITQKGFKTKIDNIQDSLNYSRNCSALGLMKTDNQKEKILIIFGGVEQHVNFLSFEAVRMKVEKNSITPIFIYESVQTGSLRYLLRDNLLSTYEYMGRILQQQGFLNKEKLGDEISEELIKQEAKTHLIEKMWYGVGKNFLSYTKI